MARGRLRLDGCVHTDVVHDGPTAQVVHWACVHDGDALRAERTHTHWVVSLLHTGACTVTQGRREAILDPATAIVHRPGSTYRTGHPFGCCDEGWSLAFDEEAAEDAIGRVGADPRKWSRPSRVLSAAPARDLLPQLAILHRLRLRQAVDGIDVEEAALHVLTRLLESERASAPEPTLRPDQRRRAERACAFLNARFRDRVRLADVARAAGCSPYHLCRIFRRHRGVTVGRYLQRLRMAAVIDALAAGHRSITDIALDCGFSSHSHLTTAFTAEFGKPPRALRGEIAGPGIPPLKT